MDSRPSPSNLPKPTSNTNSSFNVNFTLPQMPPGGAFDETTMISLFSQFMKSIMSASKSPQEQAADQTDNNNNTASTSTTVNGTEIDSERVDNDRAKDVSAEVEPQDVNGNSVVAEEGSTLYDSEIHFKNQSLIENYNNQRREEARTDRRACNKVRDDDEEDETESSFHDSGHRVNMSVSTLVDDNDDEHTVNESDNNENCNGSPQLYCNDGHADDDDNNDRDDESRPNLRKRTRKSIYTDADDDDESVSEAPPKKASRVGEDESHTKRIIDENASVIVISDDEGESDPTSTRRQKPSGQSCNTDQPDHGTDGHMHYQYNAEFQVDGDFPHSTEDIADYSDGEDLPEVPFPMRRSPPQHYNPPSSPVSYVDEDETRDDPDETQRYDHEYDEEEEDIVETELEEYDETMSDQNETDERDMERGESDQEDEYETSEECRRRRERFIKNMIRRSRGEENAGVNESGDPPNFLFEGYSAADHEQYGDANDRDCYVEDEYEEEEEDEDEGMMRDRSGSRHYGDRAGDDGDDDEREDRDSEEYQDEYEEEEEPRDGHRGTFVDTHVHRAGQYTRFKYTDKDGNQAGITIHPGGTLILRKARIMIFQKNEAPKDPTDRESRCHEPPEWRPAHIGITGPAPRTIITADKATDPIDPPPTAPTYSPASPVPTEGSISYVDIDDDDDDEGVSHLVIDKTPMTINTSPVYTSTPMGDNTHQPSVPLRLPNPTTPPIPATPPVTVPESPLLPPCVAGPSTSSRAEVRSTEDDEQTATATDFDGDLREMFGRFFSDNTSAPAPAHIDLSSAISEDLTTTLNVILKEMDLKKDFLTKMVDTILFIYNRMNSYAKNKCIFTNQAKLVMVFQQCLMQFLSVTMQSSGATDKIMANGMNEVIKLTLNKIIRPQDAPIDLASFREFVNNTLTQSREMLKKLVKDPSVTDETPPNRLVRPRDLTEMLTVLEDVLKLNQPVIRDAACSTNKTAYPLAAHMLSTVMLVMARDLFDLDGEIRFSLRKEPTVIISPQLKKVIGTIESTLYVVGIDGILVDLARVDERGTHKYKLDTD